MVCSQNCENFKSYEKTYEWAAGITALTISTIIVALLSIGFFKLNINIWMKIILFSISIIIIYIISTRKLIEEQSSDFQDFHILFKIFIITYNPICECLIKTIDYFKLDDKLSNYIDRYKT